MKTKIRLSMVVVCYLLCCVLFTGCFKTMFGGALVYTPSWAEETAKAYIKDKYNKEMEIETLERHNLSMGETSSLYGYHIETKEGYYIHVTKGGYCVDTLQGAEIIKDISAMLAGNSISPEYFLPGYNFETYQKVRDVGMGQNYGYLEGIHTYYDKSLGIETFLQEAKANKDSLSGLALLFRDNNDLSAKEFVKKMNEEIEPLFKGFKVTSGLYRPEYYDSLMAGLAIDDQEAMEGLMVDGPGYRSFLSVQDFDSVKAWIEYSLEWVEDAEEPEMEYVQHCYGYNSFQVTEGVTLSVVGDNVLETTAEDFIIKPSSRELFLPPTNYTFLTDAYELVYTGDSEIRSIIVAVDLAVLYPELKNWDFVYFASAQMLVEGESKKGTDEFFMVQEQEYALEGEPVLQKVFDERRIELKDLQCLVIEKESGISLKTVSEGEGRE